MEEIAKTFEAAGVTPRFHQGAAEIYRLLESTSFAEESPETIDRSRTLKDTIREAAEAAAGKGRRIEGAVCQEPRPGPGPGG